MNKILIPDYRRTALALWSEYPSSIRESQIKFLDDIMQREGAELYKIEGDGGEYIGFLVFINKKFDSNWFRSHFVNTYLGSDQVKKLISEVENGI